MAQYRPGRCNIGSPETALRRRAGYLALLITLLLYGVLVVAPLSPGWKLLTFFPATATAIGFLQARMKFCVQFGLRGVFNFGPLGKVQTVRQREARAADSRKAWQLIGLSSLVGGAIALVLYLLPL